MMNLQQTPPMDLHLWELARIEQKHTDMHTSWCHDCLCTEQFIRDSHKVSIYFVKVDVSDIRASKATAKVMFIHPFCVNFEFKTKAKVSNPDILWHLKQISDFRPVVWKFFNKGRVQKYSNFASFCWNRCRALLYYEVRSLIPPYVRKNLTVLDTTFFYLPQTWIIAFRLALRHTKGISKQFALQILICNSRYTSSDVVTN